MSDEKRETADDIIAEMREIADNPECVAPTGLRHMADRLEAALKREKSAIEAEALTVGGMVEASRKSEMSKNMSKNGADFGQLGNAAALREAVEGAKEKALYISRHYTTPNSLIGNMLELLASLNAALAIAAPARNCDVGTPEEQWTRIRAFCKRHKTGLRCVDCPVNGIFPKNCALIWAQMPYEGGTK